MNEIGNNQGRLFVLEGVDGSGKTTVAKSVVRELCKEGVRCKYYSFPGREKGTLGSHIYTLHHNHNKFGVKSMHPLSLQIMHIAAHIDTIASTLRREIINGTTVVLDRFWWSTYVYGVCNGLSEDTLKKAIAIELEYWEETTPEIIFLITRENPIGVKKDDQWCSLFQEYKKLFAEQSKKGGVCEVKNDGSVSKTIEAIVEKVLKYVSTPVIKQNRAPSGFIKRSPLKTTEVFNTYWHFAAERQRIFFARAFGNPPPWTDDQILSTYKFTNCYRATDRVSQYLIAEVIGKSPQTANDLFFRIILFKIFNRIETWQKLKEYFGDICVEVFDVNKFCQVLNSMRKKGNRIYSAAYIMPSGGKAGITPKHKMHLQLIEKMLNDELPLKLQQCKHLGGAFDLLRSYPTIGDFLAYQYVTDLNYSNLTSFSESEFVVPGPGAKDGIRKCFSDTAGISDAEVIKIVAENQEDEFAGRDIKFQYLFGRPLQFIDCQNIFCEVDKYARIKHPEFSGITGRTRIKQKFKQNCVPIQFVFPDSWGINKKASSAFRNAHNQMDSQ